MKKYKLILTSSVILLIFTGLFAVLKVDALRNFLNLSPDPDVPGFLQKAKKAFDKEEFMRMRSEQIALWRGMKDGNQEENIVTRAKAVEKMAEQEETLRNTSTLSARDAILAAWTPLGPDPIPNGQTVAVSTPVSGRVTAIDVHPTNPDIVYVGTAQGGLYRSLNGGATWTPLMDGAQSLAIGAVRIAPSQPDTVYVGTGEPNFSSDSYFGVGVYRIDNASTGAPVVSGPFGTQFTGRAIAEILVHPTNPATIFVASTSAAAAINGGSAPPTVANRGIYRSTDATSGAPTFSQLPYPFANQNLSARDIAFDPQNPNFLVGWVVANGGGVLVSNNALAASPASVTFTLAVSVTGATTSEVNGEVAIVRPTGAPQPTVYVATGNLGGRVLRSTDGGVTFPQQVDNNFCTPQCFYDIAIDVDPTDPNRVYLGGSPNLPFGISTTGGTAFVSSSAGLHVDSHAITVAPSNPNIIYFGSDGGVYRSDTLGAVWTPLNNAGFLATQFMSLDTHPTDPNITIGGTQDNGTNRLTTAGTWTRTDFGDGGYSVIDQSSSNTTTFNQYHTYFNASNLTGYAFSSSSTAFENWTFRGCNGGVPNDGIVCTAVINFYAPLERGPGTPNTIYYGADRLYRSIDTGNNHTTESQTFTSPLSAIGISPQNDNIRIIGLNNGGIFGTTTGANPLVDMDPTNAIPAAFVTRTVISQTDPNTAYVTLALFNAPQIFKTTNLSSFAEQGLAAPTWTAISGVASGLPQVPVNAFLSSSNDSLLYAGTDIGVYFSIDGGTTWNPFGTGLPRVAVFDMSFAPGNILRIATHGKGLYQINALPPTASAVSISGRVRDAKGTGISRALISLTTADGTVKTARTNSFGFYSFTEIGTGQAVTLQVTAKGYSFEPRVINVSEEIVDLDFVAE